MLTGATGVNRKRVLNGVYMGTYSIFPDCKSTCSKIKDLFSKKPKDCWWCFMSLDDSRDITDTTQWFSEVSDEFEVTNHYEQSVWNNFW